MKTHQYEKKKVPKNEKNETTKNALNLEYNDPFLSNFDEDKNEIKSEIKTSSILNKNQNNSNNSENHKMQFLGLIENPKSKKVIGIIKYNNIERSVIRGDTFNNIKIISINKSHFKFYYKNRVHKVYLINQKN